MAMKQLAQSLQPMPVYFILGLTVCLCFLELVIAHATHSLTLLLDAYHALCNIIVLVGSIISIKHGSGRPDNDSVATNSHEELKSLASLPNKAQMCCASSPGPERQLCNTFGWDRVDVLVMLICCASSPGPERQLRNTFGWARVNVLVMLIACVFLISHVVCCVQCCASSPGPERQLRNTFGWARVDVLVMLIACVFLISHVVCCVQCCASSPGPERQLRNTFGWARVDVLVMLIACVFLSSLCFSVLVEALQTLIHISHHDEMHAPITVLVIGVLSMFLNLLAYLMIGGYTFHQGSFLSAMEAASVESLQNGQGKNPSVKSAKRQGLWGLCRDTVGCLVVIICAIVVYSTDPSVAKFVDPSFSILSTILVMYLSYPFMKDSCLILLQTIPEHINIGNLCSQLVTAFPDIVNVHELHVWTLTADKTYCTAHIIFLNPKEYSKITDNISRFFLSQGITHVTIQPEFYKEPKGLSKGGEVSSTSDCLVPCTEDMCMDRHCCASRTPSLESVHVDCHGHKHKGSTKSRSPSSKCESSCTNSSRSKHQETAKPCSSQSKPTSKTETQSSGEESPSVDMKADLVKTEPRDVKIAANKKPIESSRQTTVICENHPAPKPTDVDQKKETKRETSDV
ncbi:proton-coupled zinc antiporter SLC30A1 [Macrosteles quadrilineatus]|uniref:proton-coupled zinc antiporter SLC30A1 n=1 Tax=Macrosteles quadrilineatus TaxID=74068 RepID=UPI0023E1EB0C|nr:proton-coupled zinc antiporter SLC30A1 [Macrosteles quadrilineatus]